MRSFIPMMSHGMSHSSSFKKLEESFLRYGQLIIYFIVIAFVGLFYIVVQKAILAYFDTLLINQQPTL